MNDYAAEVRNLVVRFGDFAAVDDVSFAVKRGEIFGFLGANGAGKTTTIRVLCGLIRPTSGIISVSGCDPGRDMDAIKARVGYMSQKFTLYNDLNVKENIYFAGSLRKMVSAKIAARAKELFEYVEFDSSPKTLVKNLSSGVKQRLALAISMLHEPEILFLDEPTAGVSPAARVKFWDLIRKVSSEGKTVFITTHYMDEAEHCGRISLMRSGKIVALDSSQRLKDAAFPHSLYEADVGNDPALEKRLSDHPGVVNLTPHGLRWHFELKAGTEVKRFAEEVGIEARVISPSLEDVFIKMVEART